MAEKQCTKCKETKPLEQFAKSKRIKSGYISVCKGCYTIQVKDTPSYKNRHTGKVKELRDIREKRRLDAWRLFANIIRIKMGCCWCGLKSPIPEVFAFHHINPDDKEFGIATGRNREIESVKIEAAKCCIICNNCHAIYHHHKKLDSPEAGKMEVKMIPLVVS